VKNRGSSCFPPQSISISEIATAHHCTPRSSRVVDLPLEDDPRVLASLLVRRSRLVVGPPRGFRNGGTRPLPDQRDLPQACAPLQSLTRARSALRRHTLTRFVVPTAQPIREDLPFSGFAFPSHVAPSHLPCASALYSLHRLPGVLSTRCTRGTYAFRA